MSQDEYYNTISEELINKGIPEKGIIDKIWDYYLDYSYYRYHVEINMDEYFDDEIEAVKHAFDVICHEWDKRWAPYPFSRYLINHRTVAHDLIL